MSLADSPLPSLQAGRRSHARRRLEALAYVDFGPDNGAILIDLGEGGLAFQSVMPVTLNQALPFKFKLPGESNHVEGSARVAWLNESGKGGGLRFVGLSPGARNRVRVWCGLLLAPEGSAPQNGNGANLNSTEVSAAVSAPFASMQEAAIPAVNGDAPAPISQASAQNEEAQPPSPRAEQTLRDDPAAEGKDPADQSTLREASPFAEFTVEVMAPPDSGELLASQAEREPLPVEVSTPNADSGPSELAPPRKAEHTVEDTAEPPEDAGDGGPHVRLEQSALPQPGPIMGISGPPPSNGPFQRISEMMKVAAAAEPNVAVKPNTAAPPAPVKAARMPVLDVREAAPASKRPRKPLPSKPPSSLPPADRQDSTMRGPAARQPQKATPGTMGLEDLQMSRGNEGNPRPVLASQLLKIAIGAAAGASLMLLLLVGIPFLRDRVGATANAKPGGSNLRSLAAFQVEVADLNNRRWILTSAGEAGSTVADTPARRETSSAASARSASSKSSRSDASDESDNTVAGPQPRLPNRAEMALSRPRATPAESASADVMAPSIFDGITPPIGSVTDHLATGGPEAPAIVPADGNLRKSSLQSAVLAQRVAPIYPTAARQAQVQGDVLVNATIGKDGVPKDLKVVKGDPLLIPGALGAIRQWRYRPATLAGQPIETQIDITINFQLK